MNPAKIQNLKNEAIAQILKSGSLKELERIRIAYLGRKGRLSQLIKEIPKADPEERARLGQAINEAKKSLNQTLSRAQKQLGYQKTQEEKEWLDITAPSISPPQGHLHLITQAINEITEIFEKIGFIRVRYPEVEWDWYAFESLNMPAIHPARDDFETSYIDAPPSPKWGRMVLTPHTSSGQVREMEAVKKPPIRMVNIGRCYRPQIDVRHTPMFHQFEGLVIDKDIKITHLKGTCDYFAREYFGPKSKTRLRPYHFQFTEPSFEVDINCSLCQGKGCRLCKEGWVELGGAGMVHPHVLKSGGLDPKAYTGFAFGWGVERVLLMKPGLKIPDLRLLYSNDLRFLNQF
jgi:phenylalanyl-tRNA synthetase alpha chain